MQSMGQPCDICGDVGIAQAILTCSNCNKSREHIYCMHPNLSSVPESWSCERCQCCVHHHDNCHCESSIQCKQETEYLYRRKNECPKGNESSKIPDVTNLGDIRMQKGSFSSYVLPTSNTSSPGDDHVYKSTGHPKFLTLGRAQSTGPQKQNQELSQPLHGPKSSLKYPGESLTTGKFESVEVITTKGKLHISDEARSSPHIYNCPSVYGVNGKSQIEENLLRVDKQAGESLTTGMFERVEVNTTKGKLHISDEARRSLRAYNCPSVYGVNGKSQIDKKFLGVDKQAGKIGSLQSMDCVSKEKPLGAKLCCEEDDTINSKHSFKFGEEDLPNPPAVKALWKGSFAVLDFRDELYDGVEAYPPGKLSRNVCLVLKEMPSVLQFKLKPRLHVWPKTFHRHPPSGFDIALYFWGVDLCRSRENYKHLMEWMREKDLCMVSRLNGVELLIFTSSQLPVESQTLNKRFYLWGIFMALEGPHSYIDLEGKPSATFALPSCRIGEDIVNSNDNDDRVVDMKVDMVGVPTGFQTQYALEGNNSSVDLYGKDVFNAPVLNSKVHDASAGAIDNTDDQEMDMDADMVKGKDVEIPDICPGSNSMAECLNNLNIPSQDVPARVNLDESTEENASTMRLHQIRTNQCNVDAFRISRPVTIDAADKGPISTSLVIMSPVHCKKHASPGIYGSNKLDEENSTAKQAPIHKQKDVKEIALVQQQQESMYRPALLHSPQVEAISSENLPPCFEQPNLLPSSKEFKRHQKEVLMQRAPIQKQKVMIQKAPIQQQEQCTHQPALLPSPQVEAIASEISAASFDQPEVLPSPKVGPIPIGDLQPGRLRSSKGEPTSNGNIQTGSVQVCLLPSSEVGPVTNGNLQPGFVQPGLLPCSRVELIPNANPQPGLLPSSRVEPNPNGNLWPGFDQPMQSIHMLPYLYQTQPIQNGNVTPDFYQPSVLPSPHTELSSSGNLYPGFDTNTGHSVYVSNIPLQVTAPGLQEIFKICGAVEGCKLIVKGESSCGFVNYFDHQSAEHAILTLNGRQLLGQPIKVSWPVEPLPTGAVNIFVGDLCPTITDANLLAFFSVFPSCLAARVVRDQTNGWSKLYGFVSFGDQREAESAIYNFNGQWLGNRRIRCNWAFQ